MKRKNSIWNKKTKAWHDRNIRKKQSKGSKYHSIKKTGTIRRGVSFSEKNDRQRNHFTTYPRVLIELPEDFSFITNPEETMETINSLIEEIKHEEFRKTIFIEAKSVKHVTVDALIYLIAIMENDCINKRMQYTYVGSFPQAESAKDVFRGSGFMGYVKSRVRRLPQSTEKMQIISGVNNDPTKAKDCCMFVMNCLGKDRSDMIPLQAVFIELMSNVYHHAYDEDDGVMLKNWYIYAEHIDEKVRVVFVDTGMGIARTVRKSFSENIKSVFGFSPKDGELLESTQRLTNLTEGMVCRVFVKKLHPGLFHTLRLFLDMESAQ